MDVKVAIPTHWRCDTIQEKTLFVLRNLWLDITIFANPFWEARKYREVLWDKYNIVEIEEFVNMPKLRNDILDYYKDWDKILMIDDDISIISKLVRKWKSLHITDKELKDLIEQWFWLCEASWYKLWWIYPNDSRLCMSNTIWYNKFIIWAFMGIIKTHLRFDEKIRFKSDYDFTLQNIAVYWWTIRFNNISTNNDYLRTKGWLQTASRSQTMSILRLKAKWWDKITIRSDKEWEILLNT